MKGATATRCTRCPADAEPGRKRCGPCRDREAAEARESYAALVVAGVCVGCRRATARDGRVMCAPCGAEQASARRARYVATHGRPGRRPAPLGDRWAAMAHDGQTPAAIARAEGVTASRVRHALAARGLWQRTPMKGARRGA